MNTLQQADFDILSIQLAQELYDPAGRLATDPSLAEHQPHFATFILDAYGLEAPSEQLLPAVVCDAAESGFEEEGLLERARAFGAEELVVPSLRAVTDRARRQASDILTATDSHELLPSKRTLVAADYIARAAYANKTRRSGSPYYTHPQQAAAMVLHVFNVLEQEGYVIEPEFKDAVICTELLHDATEETVRSCKYYDPSRPEGFSPLLVREVFTQSGNPHGRIVANSLRLMTHYAKQPWAPNYQHYVSLGSSDFIFCLAKASDMYHNLYIDPKPATKPGDEEKIRTKQQLYAADIELLSVSAPQRTDNWKNQAWARRYFDVLRNIEPQAIPKMVEGLDMYIYGARSITRAA